MYTGPPYEKGRIPGVVTPEGYQKYLDIIPSRQAVANAAGAPRKPETRPATPADPATAAAAARATDELKAREKARTAALAAAAAATDRTSETTVEQPKRAFDTVIDQAGRAIIATPDRAGALVAAGARYRKPDESMPYPAAGGGAALTKAAGGPPRDFRPYSQKIAGMAPPEGSVPLSYQGTNWTFHGGYPETGKAGPREGTRQLSGIEQAVSRRDWLEGRQRTEAALETQDVEQAAARAKAEQAINYANLDPLAMAKLQAEGHYGSEAIKQRAEASSRQQAFLQMAQLYQMALNERDPARQRQLMEMAAGLGNVLLGQRVTQNPNEMLSMLMGMGMGAPVGAAAGAAEQK